MREHSDGLMATLRCLPINAAEGFVYTRPRAFSARRWNIEFQRPALDHRIAALDAESMNLPAVGTG